jgi:hypothetical protein
MRKRLLLSVGLLAALLLGGYLLLWLTAPRVVVTQETLAKMHVGMTEAEVEELLGGPPGDYTRDQPALEPPRVLNEEPRMTMARWAGWDGRIVVFFDHRGRVSEREFWGWVPGDPFAPQKPSPLAKLRRWLGISK